MSKQFDEAAARARANAQKLQDKARKELDYDDDGDFDADDLRTKKGKRLILGILIGLAVIAAIALSGKDAKAQESGYVNVPVDCGQQVCVMPKAVWEAVMRGHNATVDENRELKAQLEIRKGCGPVRGT